jgi:Protein of unknown function (DUF3073)
MGRGRAKAKQTKVARDLKYRTHETDFGALARELHGGSDGLPRPVSSDEDLADDPDDPDAGDLDAGDLEVGDGYADVSGWSDSR